MGSNKGFKKVKGEDLKDVELTPEMELDFSKTVDTLAVIGATNEEIAAWLNVSADTIASQFSERIKKGRLKGHTSIRRTLYDKAIKGDMTALIWFTKNYMKMSEKVEHFVPEEGFKLNKLMKQVKDLLDG